MMGLSRGCHCRALTGRPRNGLARIHDRQIIVTAGTVSGGKRQISLPLGVGKPQRCRWRWLWSV